MRSHDWETKPPLIREHINRIVGTVPGFRTNWDNFVENYAGEASPPWYLAMTELANYIVEQYAIGTTNEFTSLFGTIETLLQIANPQLESLITVGLFEDIQNITSHRSFDSSVFRCWALSQVQNPELKKIIEASYRRPRKI
jgi:hypothetical protein